MNAPDKIYMPNELLSEEWQRHIEGEDTEYIRKDALMEMLLTMEARHSVFYLEGKIVREIINKISSL